MNNVNCNFYESPRDKVFNFSEQNCKKYIQSMRNVKWDALYETGDINEMYNILVSNIVSSSQHMYESRNKKNKVIKKPWLTPRILKCVDKK